MTQEIGKNIVRHQLSLGKTPGENTGKTLGEIRYDLEIIAELIKPRSKVLDIGCGDGELLEFLKKIKNSSVQINDQQQSARINTTADGWKSLLNMLMAKLAATSQSSGDSNAAT